MLSVDYSCKKFYRTCLVNINTWLIITNILTNHTIVMITVVKSFTFKAREEEYHLLTMLITVVKGFTVQARGKLTL